MKNIKKLIFGFAIICIVALCPIMLAACGGKNNYGKNISRALTPAITILKEHSAQSTLNTFAVEYEPVEEGVTGNVFILDYIKAITSSSKYEYTTSPFKGTATVSQGTQNMTVLSFNRFSIDNNKISVEMYFSPEGLKEIDYEWMQIDYDFEHDKINSFEWYEYVTYVVDDETQEVFWGYKYENETLSEIVADGSEYVALKDSIKARSTALAQAQDFVSKIYDFTQEYIDVYNQYNQNAPIE